ncbi:DUF2201 family putative metallopeptidase [Billgrantia ethanolica]|uniref:Putative metallopeptidase domain-containing protein n=1 Tax=Billgrantia ethanolica TaxID=2733486 RepID=A0ABS9A711_9GAMM|nr:hypothetical protein [Halomonas ethanolica]MCE8004420.1 hypothetical protein [Halomonas ethanolica]
MSHIASCVSLSWISSRVDAAQVSAWQQDHHVWLATKPVTAALAEPLEVVAITDERLPTATTDGRRLMINPTWSAMLNESQRRRVHEHLVWHAAAGDYRPHYGKDSHRWHLACDHSINAQLLQLGGGIPLDSVMFPLAASWRREEVYNWLSGHPRLEMEQSPDQLTWQAGFTTSNADLTELDIHWQQHIRKIVQNFLGTPWLPDSVASWLLGNR